MGRGNTRTGHEERKKKKKLMNKGKNTTSKLERLGKAKRGRQSGVKIKEKMQKRVIKK